MYTRGFVMDGGLWVGDYIEPRSELGKTISRLSQIHAHNKFIISSIKSRTRWRGTHSTNRFDKPHNEKNVEKKT